MAHSKKRFKTSLICSSSNIDLSIKVHKEVYMNKYERQQIEISTCTPYIKFFEKIIILRTKEQINKAKENGFTIHYK